MTQAIGEALRSRLVNRSDQELVDELFTFMKDRGQSHYDEAVTQIQHGLQCAHLSREQGLDDYTVTAALLHDSVEDAPERLADTGAGSGADVREQALAAIAGQLSLRVAELVRAVTNPNFKELIAARHGYAYESSPYDATLLNMYCQHLVDLCERGPLDAAVIKFAQGSSTTSMIVTSGMIVAMIDPVQLSFDPVYVAMAIGGGSLVGSWMNDSGFWIFAKMGGLTEIQTLRCWTPTLVIIGAVTFAMSVLLALVLPLV